MDFNFFFIKSSSQLDLVLQSEEGGDLSGFMPNGYNFWYLLSFIVYLGVSILIIHSHFMRKRYIFTISYFQVNGRCWACPEKGVRSSTPPGLSLMLTSPSQSRSGELFFYFYLLFLCHVIILSFFNLFKSWSKVKRAIHNSITGYIISKQAADVVLLLQLNRTLRLDLLHGSAWLHSSTRRWRETHSRSSWTQSQFLSPFTKYSFWSTFSGKISHSPERLDLPDLFENISLVSVRHVS